MLSRCRMPLLVRVFVCVLGAATTLGAQSSTRPTFRTGVDLVQLDVVVLDKNRQPVTGLSAADFSVIEDGQPRPIEAFSAITLPAPPPPTDLAAWTRDVAPDVVTNQRPDEGRLVVIVFDRTIPAGEPTLVAKKTAHAIIDALGPGDLAAVIRTSKFAGNGFQQNFTSDRRRLHEAAEAQYIGFTEGGLGPPLPSGECMCGLCVLETLTEMATALSQESRRQKQLFFVGSEIGIEGRPTRESSGTDCPTLLLAERQRTLQAIDRANITFHAMDPLALQTLQTSASSAAFVPNLQRDNMTRLLDLRALPDYTGGRLIANTNAPEQSVPQLFAESRSYYLIAFPQADGGHPGDRRRINVRVNRPGVTVRARSAYFAPVASKARTPALAPSEAAATALLPARGLSLRLALTPTFDDAGRSGTRVTVGFDDLPGSAEPLDVTIGAFDAYAKQKAGDTLSNVMFDRLRDRAPAFEHLLTLDPGRYEVRVGVSPSGDSATASVYGYVDVPDLKRDTLALSGITISTAGATTLQRVFAEADDVRAEVQVHRGERPVSLAVRVVDARDREVAAQRLALSDAAFSRAGVASYALPLPLRGLHPGDYLLTMEAADGRRTERTDVRFAVK